MNTNDKKTLIVFLGLVVLFVISIFIKKISDLEIIYVLLCLVYMLRYNKSRKEKL